ncbi:class I adenylate-forming enzyme family protein [Streptosporangium sp. NPDC087985]|uniref:class I adenylate-forming enzyme family protein n=1 Tax=Streptosporangium sp. NPDC087985 TaxID=3366196 RepID=UPI003804B9DC
MLGDAIERAGDAVAVRARGDIRTHRELLRNATRLAHGLSAQGLRAGDRVGIMAEDRVETLEAYVGTLLGGFVPVHINDRLQAPEVGAILERADASSVIYTDGRSAILEAVPGLIGDGGVPVIGIGNDLARGSVAYADLIASGSSTRPDVPRDADDLAFVGYTSGTTGLPKGVAHTQRTMLRILRHMPVHWSLVPRGRMATTGSFSFVSGIWGIFLPHLYLGGEISFMGHLAADEWVDRMIAEGSMTTSVPTPLAPGFIDAVRQRPEVLDSLQTVLHSGSLMPSQTKRELVDVVGRRFLEAYGMTETGAPVTRTTPEDWTARSAAEDVYASSGRPVHIAEVSVLGQDGCEAAVGDAGELAVRSETLFAGYYQDRQATDEVMRDGWFRTGDIGRVDEAGYVYITDRLKDMIVSGGMNVFPAEVEQVLTCHAGIEQAAVFGVPHPRWGETVVATVVRRDDSLTESAIIDWVRAQLASYKKPTEIRFVRELPVSASRKVDKRRLREAWVAG